jgi:hypothetical protein
MFINIHKSNDKNILERLENNYSDYIFKKLIKDAIIYDRFPLFEKLLNFKQDIKGDFFLLKTMIDYEKYVTFLPLIASNKSLIFLYDKKTRLNIYEYISYTNNVNFVEFLIQQNIFNIPDFLLEVSFINMVIKYDRLELFKIIKREIEISNNNYFTKEIIENSNYKIYERKLKIKKLQDNANKQKCYSVGE